MSQFAPALKKIEKLSGLEGKIVRPLSAALLPATDPEKNGLDKKKRSWYDKRTFQKRTATNGKGIWY